MLGYSEHMRWTFLINGLDWMHEMHGVVLFYCLQAQNDWKFIIFFSLSPCLVLWSATLPLDQLSNLASYTGFHLLFIFSEQDFLSHNKVKTQANFEFFDQIGRVLTMIFSKLSATEVGHLQCVTCIDKCFNKHMSLKLWSWHSTSDEQILSCLSWSAIPSWNNNTRFIWWCL